MATPELFSPPEKPRLEPKHLHSSWSSSNCLTSWSSRCSKHTWRPNVHLSDSLIKWQRETSSSSEPTVKSSSKNCTRRQLTAVCEDSTGPYISHHIETSCSTSTTVRPLLKTDLWVTFYSLLHCQFARTCLNQTLDSDMCALLRPSRLSSLLFIVAPAMQLTAITIRMTESLPGH